MANTNKRNETSPVLRVAIDYGPLLIFLLVNWFAPGPAIAKILAATGSFMVAMCVAMALSWWKTRHISPMLWISGILVLVFGGLTLYFHDSIFIKLKPTIIYLMFAVVLGYGLLARKPLLEMLLGTAYPGLSERGWRLLTINWTLFFVALAVLNEIVWRVTAPGPDDDLTQWAAFKFPGVPIITFLFAAANIPMLLKNGLQLEDTKDEPSAPVE